MACVSGTSACSSTSVSSASDAFSSHSVEDAERGRERRPREAAHLGAALDELAEGALGLVEARRDEHDIDARRHGRRQRVLRDDRVEALESRLLVDELQHVAVEALDAPHARGIVLAREAARAAERRGVRRRPRGCQQVHEERIDERVKRRRRRDLWVLELGGDGGEQRVERRTDEGRLPRLPLAATRKGGTQE
eukprot:6123499-Prymnesium_polylepis.1